MTSKVLKTSALVGAFGMAVTMAFFTGQATARQPHMHAALDNLRAARDQLNDASPNKGGHRVEALRLTNAAIDQVQMGIDHAEDW